MRTRHIASLVLLGLAVGCSSQGGAGSTAPVAVGDPRNQPALGPVQKLTNAEELSLPLDYYRASPQQRVTLLTANNMLIRDCMKRFGFDWVVQSIPVTNGTGRRYGISNTADAADYGYNLPPDRRGGSQPKQGEFTPPSPAEQTVFSGEGPRSYNGQEIPAGGCNGEAARKFGLTEPDYDQLVNAGKLVMDLSLRSEASARSDTRLVAAYTHWSGCMKEAGYDYRTPWDANNDPDFDGDKASKKERATALKDIECRNRFNVAGVNLAVESAYQNRFIEVHAEALRNDKVKLDGRLRLASSIVAGR